MALIVLHVIGWTSVVSVDPTDVASCIHMSTAFTLVMMSAMCLALFRDRSQPRLLRWITTAILSQHMIASIVQSIIEQRRPPSDSVILENHNAWYLLQGALFQIAFFSCVLFMVGTRLSRDLREKNEALSREVQERRRLEARLSTSLDSERALREEQQDFMRVVSHEFRTPLAIIRNATDMISLTPDNSPGATRERIDGIGDAVTRLFALIDRFMNEDRDAGFQPEPIKLG